MLFGHWSEEARLPLCPLLRSSFRQGCLSHAFDEEDEQGDILLTSRVRIMHNIIYSRILLASICIGVQLVGRKNIIL